MKRRPLQDEDDGGGLDSLLDTMTNVVGILVLVLIATQLGVKDAVDRIADMVVIDSAAIEKAEAAIELSLEQRQMLEQRLNEFEPVDDRAITVQLANLRRQMDQTRTQLIVQQQAANQYAKRIEADKKKAEAAIKKIEEEQEAKAKIEELQQQITKVLEEERALKAALADMPVQQAPPPKLVTLPDPRPAPAGAQPVILLCAGNKVYPIADDDWRDTVRKKAEYVVRAKRLDGGPAVGVDEEQFFKEFKRLNRSLRDEFFDVEIYASGIYPRLRFIPRENSGATIDEVLNPRSRFQQMLNVLDKSKYYARFIVLPDSFEVYLAARAVADDKGLLSGWEPQSDGWQFTTHLGGPILFGPKPLPDPNAKPAPPAKSPAKPQNVID